MNANENNARNSYFKVLVVDADFLGRHLVGQILRVQGFQTALAASGDEALHKLTGAHFDLVVSNVDMPGMNGIQLLSALRVQHPHLPIILMTSSYAEALRELTIAWGASDLLRRPLAEGELLKAVNHALTNGADREREATSVEQALAA